MSKGFVCRFAVGKEGLAYSGVWRVWTSKNKPDIFLAAEPIAGQMKATVHRPWPPHDGWRRHYGIPIDASGKVVEAVKKDSGPHQFQWTGREIGSDCTLEIRVIFGGKSLKKNGTAARADTALLPLPTEKEAVEVAVLLGPATSTIDYPRYADATTHLLNEGRLSDGWRVWVVYYTTPMGPSEQHHILSGGKFYGDVPTTDFSNVSLRAAVYGPQSDGSLVFRDMSIKVTPKTGGG